MNPVFPAFQERIPIVNPLKKNPMEKMITFEKKAYRWMSKNCIVLLRITIGIVFFWFGVQKFFPGVSTAEELATRTIEVLTFGLMGRTVSMPLLAIWEVAIGIIYISGKGLRIGTPLLFLQMIGTMTPLVFFPADTFTVAPLIPELVGQYIIKNIIIIAGAMVIGAHNVGLIHLHTEEGARPTTGQ